MFEWSSVELKFQYYLVLGYFGQHLKGIKYQYPALIIAHIIHTDFELRVR